MVKHFLFILIFTLIGVSRQSWAQQFESDQYRIESGSFIFQPEIPTGGGNYDLSAELSAEAKNQFSERGFVVRVVESTDKTPAYLRLYVSKSQLAYDDLESKRESLQSIALQVQKSPKNTFQAVTYQEDSFSNSAGGSIKATKCDSVCSPTSAGAWKNASGFGYRVENSAVEFASPDNFRSFFERDKTQKASIIASGLADDKGKSETILFKVRAPQDLAEGVYRSTVVIAAFSDF